jgi:serine/threonine-protein kinase
MPIVGDVLADRYRLDAPLGAGGMASVWRAHDLRLGRDVALKLLPGNLAGDAVVAARFEREARALAASSHPNVVAVYDVEPGDRALGREPYYVMELCDGGSLAERIAGADAKRLRPGELVPILAAIAEGLASLHDRGVVHRDVKPHNVLLCGGRAKLADFGLARGIGPGDLAELTATGTTVGTLAYLAPEVLDGQPATAASDVYGLGVVAFQGLTGRLPRPSGSVSDVVASRNLPVPRASEVAPRLGRGFDGPLDGALARDPDARPDARTFARELSEALGGPDGASIPVADADAATQAIPIATSPAARRGPTRASAGPPGYAPGGWNRAARRRRSGRAGPAIASALLAVLALVILAAAMNLLPGLGGGASPLASVPSAPSVTPTLPASPSPSLPPSPSPSASPPPSTSPSTPPPTPDPMDAVRSTHDDLVQETETAREGGLRRRDAMDIVRSADDALERAGSGDADGARSALDQIRERIDRASEDIDDATESALRAAAEAFADAVEGALGA